MTSPSLPSHPTSPSMAMEERMLAILEAFRKIHEELSLLKDGLEALLKALEARVSEEKEPQPALEGLEGLPWKPYKSGKGFWIFSNLPGASALKECLEKAPGKTLVLGGFRYRLQGEADRFIARYPHRKPASESERR
ncbi:MAG: hypothetical protein QXO94_06305 [Candidatus Bathyarchaeia archaeon]